MVIGYWLLVIGYWLLVILRVISFSDRTQTKKIRNNSTFQQLTQ
jgi:hypothetical protein